MHIQRWKVITSSTDKLGKELFSQKNQQKNIFPAISPHLESLWVNVMEFNIETSSFLDLDKSDVIFTILNSVVENFQGYVEVNYKRVHDKSGKNW